MHKKRLVSGAMLLAFVLFAMAPEAFAHNRSRNGCRSGARSYYGYSPRYQGYSPRYQGYSPRYQGVAGRTYYDSYYGERRRSGIGSTGRAILTVAGPAAVGAGVGALTGGKRGAAVGALLGGGGGAVYYLLKNRNRNRRW